MNTIERIKMVKAMEFIVRQVNNECLLEGWLMDGVADGDIEYGNLGIEVEDLENLSCYTEDKSFADLMQLFLAVMREAKKDGGLYCDEVVSKRSQY